ncbi:lanthionine synthetase LanC family protein [Nonomuraea sp. SBT364]|uniref:lanthionine synthetase LanC family protein n=1 Tax=Nonomuraea sp. SBT364 TaxID=1580530 RepID=UPI00066BBBC3|nr:lanthionine synthetase LanC family protein [Nonomuraea sp. SBT364]
MGSDTTRAHTPLDAAIEAARWIRSAAVDDGSRRHWAANPDHGGRAAVPAEPASLYAGAAGIVLFFLELAAATGDEAYLEDARAGARYLVATWRDQADLTLYHGLAGTVVALAEAGWALGDAGFEEEAATAAARIAAAARPLPGGPGWTGDPAQRGDGGIVLGLLRAATALGVRACEEVALEAGGRIAALAVPGHRFGAPPAAGFPGGDEAAPPAVRSGGDRAALPEDAVAPGFLAGTAGTAFLLARLYGATGDPRFLEAARRGAGFVREVSVVAGRCAVVPHHVPQARELHYLGFCSGSAGVARMFHELHRVAGDPGDLDWVERLALGVIESEVPHRRTPGFWNVACQCCGAAGLLELFVGLWSASGCEAYLEHAGALADHLIGTADGADGRGLRWYQAYRRLRPGELTADTGYMVGAAGIGAALLHLDAALHPQDGRRVILLPDNPFPPARLQSL